MCNIEVEEDSNEVCPKCGWLIMASKCVICEIREEESANNPLRNSN